MNPILKIIFFIFLSICFVNGEKSDSIKVKNPRRAFFASIIPGGGQIYNGKLVKGSLLIGFQFYVIDEWIKNSKIYSDYESGDYILRKNRYLEKRNKYAWWIVFAYFYGMIDAIVDAHLSPFENVMENPIIIEEKEGGNNEQ